jgi:hypothetical protein
LPLLHSLEQLLMRCFNYSAWLGHYCGEFLQNKGATFRSPL